MEAPIPLDAPVTTATLSKSFCDMAKLLHELVMLCDWGILWPTVELNSVNLLLAFFYVQR